MRVADKWIQIKSWFAFIHYIHLIRGFAVVYLIQYIFW